MNQNEGNLKISGFTYNQTTIMKAVAILSIMLHNLLHKITPLVDCENEFVFNSSFVHSFFSSLADKPGEFLNIFFSYFGHYGVQIFILLSGYGLAVSFKKKTKSWGCFMVGRLKKIYSMMLAGAIAFFLLKLVTNCSFLTDGNWRSLGLKFVFASNFMGNEWYTICGPWWFFGLIIQLYLFFPLFYKLIRKHGLSAFVTLSLVSYAYLYICAYTRLVDNSINLKCFIGHTPEFCLGILLACKNEIKGDISVFILAITSFVLGNFYKWAFLLTFLSVAYISVFLFVVMIRHSRSFRWFKKPMLTIGKYSTALFIIHGMFRWAFSTIANTRMDAGMTILLAIIFVILSIILAISTDALYKWIYDKLNRIIKIG